MTDKRQEIRDLIAAATKGEWTFSRYINADGSEPKTREEFAAILAQSVQKSEGNNENLYGVGAKDDKGDLVVCYTGNGPTSFANAAFLSASKEIVAYLLSELDAALEVVGKARRWNKDYAADEKASHPEETRIALSHAVDAFDARGSK